MQLFKIHTFYVVANSLEQAKESVKDNLPASYFSESVCPVHVVAVEQSRALDATPCVECGGVEFANWQECKNASCGCMRLRQ
jgi:hypothetical protein